VLQCVECSVLQCVALFAMCYSVLQHVAVYCSVLQCVAVCCSVLQCVAVRGSVSKCVATIIMFSADTFRKCVRELVQANVFDPRDEPHLHMLHVWTTYSFV